MDHSSVNSPVEGDSGRIARNEANLPFLGPVRGVAVRLRRRSRSRVPAPGGSSEVQLVAAARDHRVSCRGDLADLVAAVRRSLPEFVGGQGGYGKLRLARPADLEMATPKFWDVRMAQISLSSKLRLFTAIGFR